MAKYIDKDKLKQHYAWWAGGTRTMTMDEAKSDFDVIVDLQPTIEAEPIKHGRWIYIRDEENNGLYECSECHKGDIHAKECEVPYCWWCGAKMDEVEE